MDDEEENTGSRRQRGPLRPDAELWAALDEGRGLEQVLADFYGRVYEDPRLAHFFEGTTKRRAMEKQFSFLRSILTGSRDYFGMRPKNAHHWMVIDDDLFDHREELFASCLRRYGLPEPLVARLRAISEVYRKQIVKERPIPRSLGGVVLPLEGHERLVLLFAGLCDGCGGSVAEGEEVKVHRRTGHTRGVRCCPDEEESP